MFSIQAHEGNTETMLRLDITGKTITLKVVKFANWDEVLHSFELTKNECKQLSSYLDEAANW